MSRFDPLATAINIGMASGKSLVRCPFPPSMPGASLAHRRFFGLVKNPNFKPVFFCNLLRRGQIKARKLV